MSYIPSALQAEVDRRTQAQQEALASGEGVEAELMARVRRELDFAKRAADLVEELGSFSMERGTRDYLTIALSTQHRTILGQIMAVVSKAVAPEMGEGDRHCPLGATHGDHRDIIHRTHDGRLTCETVIGATLARHQPII